jgi:hypothetical protein
MTVEQTFAAVSSQLLAEDPKLEQGRIFNSVGLKARGKFLAFARRGEVVVKLPADRVTELVRSGAGEPFRSGGTRVMREWVTLRPTDEDTCAAFVAEARAFAVSATRGEQRRRRSPG